MPAGSLTLWRLHARTCPRGSKDRRWTRCGCGIWVANVPYDHPDYIFWNAKSAGDTTVKSWNRVFHELFATAKPAIVGGHAHRFRDTFAVSLLLNWP